MVTRVFTATEKRAAVTREIAFRRYVYPSRVSTGKMTKSLADEQIAVMEAIEADYREQEAGERLL